MCLYSLSGLSSALNDPSVSFTHKALSPPAGQRNVLNQRIVKYASFGTLNCRLTMYLRTNCLNRNTWSRAYTCSYSHYFQQDRLHDTSSMIIVVIQLHFLPFWKFFWIVLNKPLEQMLYKNYILHRYIKLSKKLAFLCGHMVIYKSKISLNKKYFFFLIIRSPFILFP